MVDALVPFALENLARLGIDEVQLLRGTEEEIDKLTEILRVIQASLHDAEMRQFKEKKVNEWLNKLKYAAYEVNDVLDEWKVKSQQLSTHDAHSGNLVWNIFTQCICFQHLILRHNIGKKIKKINEKLDQIANEKTKFNFLQSPLGVEVGNEIVFSSLMGDSRMTSSFVDMTKVFGRDDEKNKIKNMLMNEGNSEQSDIHVISIVGTGGYGKTTLAQFLFNDDEVKAHFQQLIWVCVSEQFDVAKIVKKIIEVITMNTPNAVELEALQNLLWENLPNKRFLLVLDDVWNEDYRKWEKLRSILEKCGAKGSRILVTTRHKKVASVMHSSLYSLGLLPPDACWSVFEKVTGIHEHGCSGLIEIGREIVAKCKGLPLAIKAVAGTLSTKKTLRDWENVRDAEIWDWDVGETDILPALMLSYYHLPPQLKRCFQFCAIYPKDSELEKEKLVNMWISQGCIPQDRRREMEDIGEDYFEELLGRSLFQEPERDNFGNVTKCKMHDMVHNLAQFVTNEEFTYIDASKDNSMANSRKVRHCTWIDEKFDETLLSAFEKLYTLVAPNIVLGSNLHVSNRLIEQLRCIRVLRLHGIFNLKLLETIGKLVHLRYLELSSWKIEALPESLMKLRNLRYLILENTGLKELPESVGGLGQLRHLNLENTEIENLPESITGLTHLQVLNLDRCRNLCKLPSGIQKMTSLKRLGIISTDKLTTFPAGIGKLTSLRILNKFILTAGVCNLSELRHLNHLQGRLFIENLEVGSIEEAVNAKLEDKRFIQSLYYWSWSTAQEEDLSRAEGVLEALRPYPSSLRRLLIREYQGSRFPSWVGDPTFSNLSDVDFWGCPNCVELPALGNLPHLQILEIRHFPKLGKVGGEFFGSNKNGGFPKLDRLYLEELENWEEWESVTTKEEAGVGRLMMPHLSNLDILGCSKLKALPSISSEALKRVSIRRCPNLIGLGSIPPSVEIMGLPVNLLSKLPSLPKLHQLEIYGDSSGVEVMELSNIIFTFTELRRLKIESCPHLRFLPEQMSSLKKLELIIRHCPTLEESCRIAGVQWSMGAHIPTRL